VPIIAANSWKWIRMGKGAAWKGRVYAKGPKDSHGASLRDNPNNF
jgi:hypothetical protein